MRDNARFDELRARTEDGEDLFHVWRQGLAGGDHAKSCRYSCCRSGLVVVIRRDAIRGWTRMRLVAGQQLQHFAELVSIACVLVEVEDVQ